MGTEVIYEVIITNGAMSLGTYEAKSLKEEDGYYFLEDLVYPANVLEVKIPKRIAVGIKKRR